MAAITRLAPSFLSSSVRGFPGTDLIGSPDPSVPLQRAAIRSRWVVWKGSFAGAVG